MSCSELVEIEDLVLGTIAQARARELRAHLVSCTPCRVEEATRREERALFTQREACIMQPSAALGAALRAQLTLEVADGTAARACVSATASRLGPALVSVLRRGHASAACAAALFAFVAFSKLGGAPIVPADEASGGGDEHGPRASLAAPAKAEESLACTETAPPLASSSLAPSRVGATTQLYSTFSAVRREELACENGNLTSCEGCVDVTCPPHRQ